MVLIMVLMILIIFYDSYGSYKIFLWFLWFLPDISNCKCHNDDVCMLDSYNTDGTMAEEFLVSNEILKFYRCQICQLPSDSLLTVLTMDRCYIKKKRSDIFLISASSFIPQCSIPPVP